jgi:metal-sulfur cluster biosynthetic enzyme
MSELPTWARDALAGVYDPCCREKGISVLDMGLVRSVQVEDGVAKVELLLTSGWCPFAAGVLSEVKSQIVEQPGISDADVSIVWDEAWTTDRLSPRARDILRFLPAPAAVADREDYIRRCSTITCTRSTTPSPRTTSPSCRPRSSCRSGRRRTSARWCTRSQTPTCWWRCHCR